MNLEKLFEMQKKLDEHIIEKKGLQGNDLLPNTILALQVELGELANEWRGFKHWSDNREPRLTDDSWYVVENTIKELGDKDGFHIGHEAEVYKKIRRNPLLEEFVDNLHFILSIGLQLEVKQSDLLNYPTTTIILGLENLTDAFQEVFGQIVSLRNTIEEVKDSRKDRSFIIAEYEILLLFFLDLGRELGFSLVEIEQAYMEKNKVNHERQESGY